MVSGKFQRNLKLEKTCVTHPKTLGFASSEILKITDTRQKNHGSANCRGW